MLQKTPLYHKHIDLNARMIEFVGWDMPVMYSGIIEEHQRVRRSVGIFDVSHMGEIDIKGAEAISLLQRLLVGDVASMRDGQVLYSLMCLPNGGILDDLLVYRFSKECFMLCVNASNTTKDFGWIKDHIDNSSGIDVKDISSGTALLALQGQKAVDILDEISDVDISGTKYYEFKTGTIAGVLSIISRTGYTGEDGFEIFCDARKAEQIWDKIMDAEKKYGPMPVGLAARDILRLEMKYPLHGSDISETTTPIEAGLGWTISYNKGDFIGRDIMFKQKEKGVSRKLVGFEMLEKGIPRPHYNIYKGDTKIGEVTSGSHSPALNKGIGLGYLNTGYTEIGLDIEIEVRHRRIKARIAKTPFYPSSVKK